MIITDDFVFVHLPKTGGTFVESVLRKVHQKRGDIIEERHEEEPSPFFNQMMRWGLRRPTFLNLHQQVVPGEWNQHGSVGSIPKAHQHKPVIATLRHPLDRYVSQYEFQWWKGKPKSFLGDADVIMKDFPTYPDISFEMFIEILNRMYRVPERFEGFDQERHQLGRQTTQFMGFYMPTLQGTQIDAPYLAEKRFLGQLYPNVHFLFMHNLNQNLYETLLGLGYDDAEIGFIPKQQKIFPKEGGRREDQAWQHYYTPELKAHVMHLERVLFELFPEFEEAAPQPVTTAQLCQRFGVRPA
ncbi:MAG: sulfotransferase family 2 domain-containing protein [Anaerolineae bacterium]|jgi:hypothetical protein|nr:sulfotransferase family 2 domain-containing protein [Anaerolineae bacterium]